jgi:asparaginyl-tRNA synthetase
MESFTMQRILIKNILSNNQLIGQQVKVCGWVRTRRDSKAGFSFIELNDGSCFANLQLVVPAKLANYKHEISQLFPGSSIAVNGKLVASQGDGQAVEIQAEAVKVFGFAEPEQYPIGKQRVSFERLRELAHLRPRTNTFGAIARIRHALAIATHNFFAERDFLYIHTPIITASDCEGAGEMFQVTTLDQNKLPRDKQNKINYKQDFFGRKAHLTVSGQLEGELYACALGNIYTFGPTFRAENSNTRRHLAEFWMIEPEMAFADLDDDAQLAEDYLKYLFCYLLEHCRDDLEFFNQRIAKGLIERLTTLAIAPFKRITYSEAITILEAAECTFDYPVKWGIDMQSEHERYLTEQHFSGPVIVTDYPKEIKSFYMRLNDDNKTVAAMDVLLPEVGEIIGGSQREDRLELLEARMQASGIKPESYWWYLDLRRFGSVPHAGFGLGFERMVQFCTGMHNIRDVIPFPRTPNHIEF